MHLMPGAAAVVPQMTLPLAVWANRASPARATSGAGSIAPDRQWISLGRDVDQCGRAQARARLLPIRPRANGVRAADVLFVGNQLNADVAGGEASGIRTVWVSGSDHHSPDDTGSAMRPNYSIATLSELPALLERLTSDRARTAPRVE